MENEMKKVVQKAINVFNNQLHKFEVGDVVQWKTGVYEIQDIIIRLNHENRNVNVSESILVKEARVVGSTRGES